MHLFYTIMAELINVYEDDLTKEDSYSHNSVVIPMLRYIERNFRTCTQESVADFFHISPNYVTRLLKKYSVDPGAETTDRCQPAEADKSSDN